jgi:hypothetical protein
MKNWASMLSRRFQQNDWCGGLATPQVRKQMSRISVAFFLCVSVGLRQRCIHPEAK